MSIHVKLYIDEIEYNVLKFDFDFQKAADVNGRPTTKYIGGLFNFTIEWSYLAKDENLPMQFLTKF